MLIEVGEKYLCCFGRFKAAETLGPFDNNSGPGIVENLVEPKAVEGSGFDAVEIDVVDGDPAFVLVDQRECGARDFARVFDAECLRQSFREKRLARAEVAIKKYVCRQLHRPCKLLRGLQRL